MGIEIPSHGSSEARGAHAGLDSKMLRNGIHDAYKKLCYRRRTARRDVSVKILPTAAQQCSRTTCATSREQIEAMELKGYGRPTYNKLVHSATTRSTVVGAIHKLAVKSTSL